MPAQLVAGKNDGEAGDPEGGLLGYDQPEELKAGFSEFSSSRPQLDAPAPRLRLREEVLDATPPSTAPVENFSEGISI